MIKVKIFSKPKKNASAGGTIITSSGVVNVSGAEADHSRNADYADKAGFADKAGYAETADYASNATYSDHAKLADEAVCLEKNSPVYDTFLRKDKNDKSDADYVFNGNVEFCRLTSFLKGIGLGSEYSIQENGDAVLGNVMLDRTHSTGSTAADRTIIGGQGFDLYMGEDGKSHLYVDYLVTRVKAFFAQLEIRKISYSGGTTLFSNAGSTLAKVVAVLGSDKKSVVAYKCYAVADDGETRTMNWWKVGMMALCQTFNIKSGTTENASNRYYWRMVVGTGQETLEDGKVYDYVLLSNVKTFKGNDSIVPSYGTQLLADNDGKALSWAGFALGITVGNSLASVASIMSADGITKDEDGDAISGRTFYGYDEGSDVPLPGDVIVQAGDEIRWNSYGNVIKLATSTEDNGTDNAPSITMYHGMGKVRDGGVWQWKDVVSLQSPSGWVVNAERFSFFTGSINELTSLSSLAQDVSNADGQITTINATIKGLSSTVGQLTKDVNNNGENIGGLTKRVSNVEQRADSISLRVDQQAVRDRNLLPDSYFLHGSSVYGFCNRKVRLEKDKCYALTIWGKVDTTLKARGGKLYAYIYACDASGVWTWTKGVYIDSTTETSATVKFSDVPSDGEYSFAAYPYPQKDNGGCAIIRCAQVEEIPSMDSEGTAWTLGKKDPTIYGNFLPHIGEWDIAQGCTLTAKGASIEGHWLDVAYGKATAGQVDIIALSGKLSVVQGESYTLSFWAKGSGTFMSYLYNGDLCAFAVRDDDTESQRADGSILPWRELTSDWRRYWITFSVKTSRQDANIIPLRLEKGGEAWLAGVKLEPFGRMTDFTEDGVSVDELLASGIDILNRKIIATADTFEVRNNKGEVTTTVDADGQLTAGILATKNRGSGFINAEDGLLKVFNGNGLCNILFGIDANSGMMVLSYYDNSGNLLYNLGPNGLENKDLTNSVLTEYEAESLGTFFNNPSKISMPGTAEYSDEVYYADDDGNYIINSEFKSRLLPTSTTSEGYEPTSALHKGIYIYYYRAAKVSAAYIADTKNGISTPALAEQANDKWFAQKPICQDDTLQFVKNGEYIMDGEALHWGKKKNSALNQLAIYFYYFNGGERERFEVFVE